MWGRMVRVHSTRLMSTGELLLWNRGKLVWSGRVGSEIGDLTFDAISICHCDEVRMRGLIGEHTATVVLVRTAIARWWD